jgi:hypothetical protein
MEDVDNHQGTGGGLSRLTSGQRIGIRSRITAIMALAGIVTVIIMTIVTGIPHQQGHHPQTDIDLLEIPDVDLAPDLLRPHGIDVDPPPPTTIAPDHALDQYHL